MKAPYNAIMKIALYYPWLYLTSGAERSILELVRRSRHDWTIFTNHYDREHTYPGFNNCTIVELSRVAVERSFTKVLSAGLKIALQKLELQEFDALLVVCEGLGDMIVFRNHDKPVFCLCLTPLRPVFDPVYQERYLNDKNPFTRLKLHSFGQLFRLLDRLAWRYYQGILCISRECYNRVLAGGLAPAHELGFAYPGIDMERLNPSGRREKYFLLPGRIMWTKNIELGIEAFKRLRAECAEAREFRLIIAGIVDKKSEPYYDSLRKLAADCPEIEFVIHPDDDRLFALYDGAYGILFTPFNEDWGIVPLEAMAYGKPVIAVNRGGAVETVEHGKCGFLAEPNREEFARRMAELVMAPEMAQRMGECGRTSVRRYDWTHFANAVDTMVGAL